MRNYLKRLVLLLCVVYGMSASAASFEYAATITDGGGVLPVLIPISSLVSGYVDFETPANIPGSMPSATITEIKLLITGDLDQPLFCLSFNVICAVNEGTIAPLVGVATAQLQFDFLGQPTAGVIDAEIFSPTFMLNLPVQLDLTAGTFSLSGTGIGFVGGPGNFQLQPVPLPASLLLFASALTVLRRRNPTAGELAL